GRFAGDRVLGVRHPLRGRLGVRQRVCAGGGIFGGHVVGSAASHLERGVRGIGGRSGGRGDVVARLLAVQPPGRSLIRSGGLHRLVRNGGCTGDGRLVLC